MKLEKVNDIVMAIAADKQDKYTKDEQIIALGVCKKLIQDAIVLRDDIAQLEKSEV